MADHVSGASQPPSFMQAAGAFEESAQKVEKKTNIAASMVQPLARAAILGSSTAAVVIGCIALAAGTAFPPTAFIALGVMAAGVALLAAGKMMNKETSIAKNTAIEAFITASAPISGPIFVALGSAVAIGVIVFFAVVNIASLVISGRLLQLAQPPGASDTSNPADFQ
jgi:hypothetical protein